ncbi:MAG: hypothetical protein A2798_00425 [Candidatus Levybacteria bacterium RIFCSPHIGHO2_01_FULL_37_17]|nr:MAG: hypothetical protein A2798_00425 [Candidatus Levybacteria bacterium RIFCSPHIGHO2_01_FULL_37_17]OGH36448.1 MAG: hypothetical protein A2959_02940 [Candidatus Levybacteria bacterium RIFCSPLOWO2_01_FULL_38_23]
MINKILVYFGVIFFLLFFPSKSFAALGATYSPASINTGGSVTITITGITNMIRGDISISLAGEQSNGEVIGWDIFNFTSCQGSSAWSGTNCNTENGTFTGTYNTSQAEFPLTNSRNYAVYFDSTQPGSGYFSFSDAPPASFSISSVTPNPAKEGDSVRIAIRNATTGNAYSIQFDNRSISRTTCATATCNLNAFTVPYVSNPNVSVIVVDENTNQNRTVGLTFELSQIGDESACVTCPNNSQYRTDQSESGCYVLDHSEGRDYYTKVAPLSQEFCNTKQYCDQGKGCKSYNVDENNPYNVGLPDFLCTKESVESGNCTINSAIGGIATTKDGFVKALLGVILSLSGGIALLLIIRSGFHLMTSQGNPEQIQAAKEQLTAAFVGLLFIIFSLVFLEVIGVDILNLPGLGK